MHISAELSGTFESAQLAAREAPVPVTVVDSRQVGMGTGYAVLGRGRGVAAAAHGRGGRRGGPRPGRRTPPRCSTSTPWSTSAAAAGWAPPPPCSAALAVKPILKVDDGRVGPLREGAYVGQGAVPAGGARGGGGGGAPVDVAVAHLASPDRAAPAGDKLSARLAEQARAVARSCAGRSAPCSARTSAPAWSPSASRPLSVTGHSRPGAAAPAWFSTGSADGPSRQRSLPSVGACAGSHRTSTPRPPAAARAAGRELASGRATAVAATATPGSASDGRRGVLDRDARGRGAARRRCRAGMPRGAGRPGAADTRRTSPWWPWWSRSASGSPRGWPCGATAEPVPVAPLAPVSEPSADVPAVTGSAAAAGSGATSTGSSAEELRRRAASRTRPPRTSPSTWRARSAVPGSRCCRRDRGWSTRSRRRVERAAGSTSPRSTSPAPLVDGEQILVGADRSRGRGRRRSATPAPPDRRRAGQPQHRDPAAARDAARGRTGDGRGDHELARRSTAPSRPSRSCSRWTGSVMRRWRRSRRTSRSESAGARPPDPDARGRGVARGDRGRRAAGVGLTGARSGSVLVGALVSRQAAAVGAAVAAAAVAGVALLRASGITGGPVHDLASERAVVTAEVTVTSDPRVGHGRFGDVVVVRGDVRTVAGRGAAYDVRSPVVLLADEEWRDVALGERVRVSGRLGPAGRRGGRAAERARSPRGRRGPGPVVAGGGRGPALDPRAVAPRAEHPRELVPALVGVTTAGWTPRWPTTSAPPGLTHLLAVCGTNLTLLVGFMLVVARWLGVRGRWTYAVGGGSASSASCSSPAPSRAWCAPRRWARWRWSAWAPRARARLAGLGVAVLGLLLVDPGLAVSAGFALSVLATGGILFLAPGVARRPHGVAAAVGGRGGVRAAGRPGRLHAGGHRTLRADQPGGGGRQPAGRPRDRAGDRARAGRRPGRPACGRRSARSSPHPPRGRWAGSWSWPSAGRRCPLRRSPGAPGPSPWSR